MDKEKIQAMNSLYCRVADKWHQMLYGFTSEIIGFDNDAYIVRTRVGTNCTHSRPELLTFIIKAFRSTFRLTEPARLRITIINVNNRKGFLLTGAELNNIDNLLDALNELKAPVNEQKDSIEIFEVTT